MPIISKIGSRSIGVRLVYGAIFAVLILGAVTMVYPFVLMLAGSTKSEADISRITLYPEFWFNDHILFQKFVESKYNQNLDLAMESWGRRLQIWRKLEPPTEKSEYLEYFLEWRGQCKWWWIGHSGGIINPVNSRQFRKFMMTRYNNNFEAMRKETGFPLKSWNTLSPPPRNLLRFPRENEGILKAFNEFAKERPAYQRILGNPDGLFFTKFLLMTYTRDIDKYNEAHNTDYKSYQEVFLSKRAPKNQKQREDWEEFVRTTLPLWYIRLSPELTDNFRSFLSQEKYKDVEEYNHTAGTGYASFDEIPLPLSLPESKSAQVDWGEFVKNAEYCPVEFIEVYGTRQVFEEYVARKLGVPVEQIAPIRLPVAEADLHDCMVRSGQLRWDYTVRNYKTVFDYLLLYGRGIPNTLIYCGLAISLALLVNPLAAYALSRYKPPSTYKILLFCMATMAFPGEVTMIPAFLLLKRFPLWPLLGGGLAFGLAIWLFSKRLKHLSEFIRMILALVIGILVGVWAVPYLSGGKPYVTLLNTFAALVMPTMANGYMIFLLKGFFDSLPRELYEAADLDGASEWTKFWSFTMALSKPILAVIALSAFTAAYSAFMFALIIIPDQKMWTLMVWLFQFQTQVHQAARYASLVVAAIPTFLVFVFCQGIIMRGIVVPTEK